MKKASPITTSATGPACQRRDVDPYPIIRLQTVAASPSNQEEDEGMSDWQLLSS